MLADFNRMSLSLHIKFNTSKSSVCQIMNEVSEMEILLSISIRILVRPRMKSLGIGDHFFVKGGCQDTQTYVLPGRWVSTRNSKLFHQTSVRPICRWSSPSLLASEMPPTLLTEICHETHTSDEHTNLLQFTGRQTI